jgi:hypothetical protein
MLRRLLRGLLILVMLVLLLGASAFVVWATNIPAPLPPALEALKESPEVVVNQEEWIEFLPQITPARTGLILYPGGKVPAEAYAPIGRALANEGYYVAILYSPLNMAIFNYEAAGTVMEAHKDIRSWVVGGHSLGGVAAALFADVHPDRVRGLLLMASTPASGDVMKALIPGSGDLWRSTSLAVTSIYATNDGLFDAAALEESKALLPPQTNFVEIVGGNHAQFGWYGPQAGDGAATMSPEEQTIQIVNAARALLETVKIG